MGSSPTSGTTFQQKARFEAGFLLAAIWLATTWPGAVTAYIWPTGKTATDVLSYHPAMSKHPTLSADDDELFRAELTGVKPLPAEPQIAVTTAPDLDAAAIEARRLAAITDKKHDSNFLSTAEPPLVEPYAEIGYRHDGVQLGVYQALRGGKYESRYVLDLHRRTVEQARNDVFQFIHDAVKREQRCVLILHGRGVRAPIPALLKSYVNVWLQQLPEVLAFHSAQKRDGGTGALYVLLKKSDDAKQENRERFGTR